MDGPDGDEQDIPNGCGYAFTQASAAIIGGVILAAIISVVFEIWDGSELNFAGFTFIVIFCIPLAWGIRAIILHLRDRRER